MVIKLFMDSPLMVVEVVSPYKSISEANYQRNYVDKRSQFEQRGIPEYWIVDPTAQKVSVLVLTKETYQESVFGGRTSDRLSHFPKISHHRKLSFEAVSEQLNLND